MGKTKQFIEVKASDVSVSAVLANSKGAPLEHRIAAMAKIKRTMEQVASSYDQLKATYEAIEKDVVTTTYKDHVKELIERGILSRADDSFAVRIENKDGSIYSVKVSGGVEDNFEISSALSKGDTFDGLDDKYKEISYKLNKKLIKDEFEAGKLPASIVMFCNKSPVDITKIGKPKMEVGPKEEEKKEETAAEEAAV